MDKVNMRTASRDVERAAFAAFKAGADSRYSHALPDPVAKARELWPGDQGPLVVLGKSAVMPLTTADVPAPSIVANPMAGFFGSLDQSAGARLIRAGTVLDLSGFATATIPYSTEPATAAPWVAEGKPIPVRDYSFAAATVGPVKKAALLTVHTREAGRAAYAEAAFTALLKRDAARSLDAAIFANTAATTSASAGLLHGVTPLPATVADTLEDMMIEDLANLASVVTTAGGHDVVFVAAPQQAAAAAIRKPELAARIWPSPALAAGTVVALDPAAFVSGFDPLPVIDSSADTVVHMEDDTPAQIGSAGDPPVAAAPARSMFQTDTVAVRLIFEMAFALGAPTIASVERVRW